MTMNRGEINPNLALFASMAAPSGRAAMPMLPSVTGMPPTVTGLPLSGMPMGAPRGVPASMSDRVIRPTAGPLAAKGRGGESMMAHMTPGEIAVPPQAQTPEVLASLNRAFAGAGANPTSFQAGNPDQKINPETGLPEFGLFDSILPMGLGLL